MSKQCITIEKNLNNHLSHYADNNKELKRLADAIERQQILNTDQERKLDEMYQVFTASNWTIKMSLRVFGGIGIITGMILGIIELIKSINR